ncbi:MAG TPA: class I SAM-dependent methyltransferase [Candidatus Dormibacteraeota bacterium]|nr:class I SAM-dependent methyltransferase [Candidatus Dormibacteraeota bacterium]
MTARRSAASSVRSVLRRAAGSTPVRHAMERTARELLDATRSAGGPAAVERADAAAAAAANGAARPARTRLNRLCGPDAWDDPAWLACGRALGMPGGGHRFHRKAFEWTQCIYGLEALGALRRDADVLGVAAGHEPVLYYCANRARLTIGTDLYRGAFSGGPAAEAAADAVSDPSRYAPFPYRRDALRLFPADALALPFRDGSFDTVLSLSSIEHFGGHEASARAVREMARVLRPGGVACIGTEWVLAGGEHPEFFSPDAFDRFVAGASDLVLVEPVDPSPPPKPFAGDPVWTDGDIERTPHLVLAHGRFRWTSVVAFLRRPG